ncbi:EAL domain-containing protein [Nocardioides sp. NPDC051685]|uniref:EAL domain-containing protein n=1 Tax=Nocardioides sp. NPDC051685 TaxID=3364334 RepID=UPI00379D1B28
MPTDDTSGASNRSPGDGGLQASIAHAIAHAIEHDQLVLHYQPILDLRTDSIYAYEGLVRWSRPDTELVPPAEFIPVAEASDLICRVGAWVIDRAASQLADWNNSNGHRRLVVSVNVSGRHINTPRIRDDVAAALHAHDIDPAQLVLEITETVSIDESAVDNLHELRRLGVGLSLDDVGTGHNTIDQLSRLPLNSIKVDCTYIDPTTPSRRRTLQELVDVAHSLGLTVCGERVEREDQLALLRSLGAEAAQGYLLGYPVPAQELNGRLSRQHASPAAGRDPS